MALVNHFKITLEDFLPHPSDGKAIPDPARSITTTVSNRLFAELIAYAEDNQLSLAAVLDQVRKELHPEPRAIKFAKGDEVKLSSTGILLMPHADPDRRGTIVFTPRKGKPVAVVWDGAIHRRYIDSDLLERSDD